MAHAHLPLDKLVDDALRLLVGLGDGDRLVEHEIEQPGMSITSTTTFGELVTNGTAN
jgi:uncharacterized short protein YbdD (DUF466 family)